MVALGILVALVVFLALYAGTMVLYVWARKKWSRTKYAVEIVTVIGAVLLSIGVKFAIFFVSEEGSSFEKGLSGFFYAVYSGFGGLGFEGLGDGLAVSKILLYLYYGSSLYAGVLFVSVFTATVSYEIFSYLNILVQRNRDVYVFTALTEDTVALACSIKNKSLTEKKKATIIFAGEDIPSFDRKDKLCRAVMSEGFLYWTYTKDDAKSIAKSLRINNHNRKDDLRFVVLAFGLDEDGMPKEEENMNTVFSDATVRARSKDDGLCVEYFILTKRDINFQAYENKNRELYSEFARHNGYDVTDGLLQYIMWSSEERKSFLKSKSLTDEQRAYKKTYQNIVSDWAKRTAIGVFNEAKAVAKMAVSQAMDCMDIDYARNPDVRVWSLGFGETSQAILNELYTATAFVGEGAKASEFLVEAFDPSIGEKNGIFQMSHPLYACVDGIDTILSESLERIVEEICEKVTEDDVRAEGVFADLGIEEFIEAIVPFVRRHMKLSAAYKRKAEIARCFEKRLNRFPSYIQEMPIPAFLFSDASCTDASFFEIIDKVTGKGVDRDRAYAMLGSAVRILEKKGCTEAVKVLADLSDGEITPVRPNVIVIATGDDFRDIQLANVLINDICNEKKNGEHLSNKQVIIVNVRDERNNSLMVNGGGVWKNNRLDLGDYLSVIIVGNVVRDTSDDRDNIYSYESVLSHKKAARYNYGYNAIAGAYYDFSTSNESWFSAISEALNTDYLTNATTPDTAEKINDFVNFLSFIIKEKGLTKEELAEKISAFAVVDSTANNMGDKVEGLKKIAALFATDEHTEGRIEDEWFKIDIWAKESNVNALSFGKTMRKLYEQFKDVEGENIYVFLSLVEHQRWSRFHIAHGWNYSPMGKDELLKRHNCILPYRYVNSDATVYDLMNVIWALCEEK